MEDVYSTIDSYETPNFYKVGRKAKFDTSTVRTEIIQLFPSGGNNESVLNTSSDIIFNYLGSAGTLVHLASDRSGIRTRFKMLTGYSGLFNGPPGQNPPNTQYANQNANISLDATFWGQLFNKFELQLGSSSGVETIDNFEPYFELMCHLQPIDFKLKEGFKVGYIPDENSGLADDTPMLSEVMLLGPNSATAVNTEASYTIWYAHNQAVAANGVISIQLMNNGNKVNLVTATALNAYAYGSYTIQAINNTAAAIAATTGTMTYNIGNGINITLMNSTGTAVAVGATGTFYMRYTSAAAVAISAIIPFPYANGGVQNLSYEPGFYKRKRHFNYPVVNDTTWRYFDVFIPLHFISGFCRDCDILIEMLPVLIKFHRNGMMYKSLIGATGTDCDLRITSMWMELEQVFPNDKLKAEFNKAISHEIDISFLSGGVMPYQLQGSAANSIPTTFSQPISVWNKTDFLFVVFKDNYSLANASPQNNASLNLNLDINKIQIILDGKYYPSIQQDGNFDANEYMPFYQRFLECAKKISEECPLGPIEYRDLYPIFGFDLTAQMIKLHNQPVSMQLTFNRNTTTTNGITGLASRGSQLNANNTLSAVQIYVIALYEKYYKANYTKQLVTMVS
jgi:hypothetical protein